MDNARTMVSVGIDIGTTTTQVVFSELSLVAMARPGQIPRMDITERKVLHESEIVFTPLLDAETIDADSLAAIIRGEYQAAGISPAQVETGAAIITGETARKKNADKVLSAIAGLAGDFVVTVAGPNVEGMIAGKGSGAAAWSRQRFTTAANLDIGGGSANGAIFRLGELASSAAMNFGGRVIELDGPIFRSATPAGEAILASAGLRLAAGDRPSLGDLRKATDAMAGLALLLLEGGSSPLAARLYQTPPLPQAERPRALMFSGGIGYYYYDPIPLRSVEDVARHGDVGPLLAESLRDEPGFARYAIQKPKETRRATVLGASAQTLTLSGSTIWADPAILPLKNLPVVRPGLAGPTGGLPGSHLPSGGEAIREALSRWDLDPGTDRYALALDVAEGLDYEGLRSAAMALGRFAEGLPAGKPLVIITRRDYAQALGQTLKGLDGGRPLLVIDQVGLEEGDYIDIGSPLMDGRVVPLVVKTLIFYH
jgi:ethanolamine utilization protein EutA